MAIIHFIILVTLQYIFKKFLKRILNTIFSLVLTSLLYWFWNYMTVSYAENCIILSLRYITPKHSCLIQKTSETAVQKFRNTQPRLSHYIKSRNVRYRGLACSDSKPFTSIYIWIMQVWRLPVKSSSLNQSTLLREQLIACYKR